MMDWTLVDGMDIGGQHGRRFVHLRHTHRPQRKPYPICTVQAGAETSDTGAQAVKSDPSCSWEGHSRGWLSAFGDKNAESSEFVRPLRILLVIHPVSRTYFVYVVVSDTFSPADTNGALISYGW